MYKRKTKCTRNKRCKRRKTQCKHNQRKYSKRGRGTNEMTNENVKCCMCEKMINKKNTLSPRECLNEHGPGAHRICQECWWDPEKGFASEDVSHKCPGCIKGLPLTPYSRETIFMDLTED